MTVSAKNAFLLRLYIDVKRNMFDKLQGKARYRRSHLDLFLQYLTLLSSRSAEGRAFEKDWEIMCQGCKVDSTLENLPVKKESQGAVVVCNLPERAIGRTASLPSCNGAHPLTCVYHPMPDRLLPPWAFSAGFHCSMQTGWRSG